jgi:hemerythrin-like domain-containing protein
MSTQPTTTWADTPLPLLPIFEPSKPSKELTDIAYIARDMANAHNSLLRILNAIHKQAPFVSNPKDIQDFLQYCKYWCMWITEHHDSEEKYLFPWLEEASGEKGLMDGNIAQHLAFEKGCKDFETYVTNTTIQDYDGLEIQRIIDSFGQAFSKHMHEEIDSLKDLERFGDKKWREIYDRFVDALRKDSSVGFVIQQNQHTLLIHG